jgi:phosphoglycerate dehydrogenase-like enzyme
VLDVAAREPLPPDHPLWTAPGAWVTPHVAGASDEEWSYLADLVTANLGRFVRGERLWNRVDPIRGY